MVVRKYENKRIVPITFLHLFVCNYYYRKRTLAHWYDIVNVSCSCYQYYKNRIWRNVHLCFKIISSPRLLSPFQDGASLYALLPAGYQVLFYHRVLAVLFFHQRRSSARFACATPFPCHNSACGLALPPFNTIAYNLHPTHHRHTADRTLAPLKTLQLKGFLVI